MNTEQMVIKVSAKLVAKGLAEYTLKDGKPGIRLTKAGLELAKKPGQLAKEMTT